MSLSTIPRRWRILLIVSLAVNLLVVGIVLGAALDRRGPDRRPSEVSGPAGPLLRALPDERRRAVLHQSRQSGPRAGRETRRALFEALLSAVRADPFRPGAVTEALAQQRRSGAARLDAYEQALVAELAAMTAQERDAFAQALSSSVRRR